MHVNSHYIQEKTNSTYSPLPFLLQVEHNN